MIFVAFLIVVFFVASTLYSQHLASGLDERAASIATDASPAIETLSAARGDVIRISMAVADAVDAGPGASGLEVRTAFRHLEQELAAYRAVPFYPNEVEGWREIQGAVAVLQQQVSRVLDENGAGHTQSARRILQNEERPAAEAADKALAAQVNFNANQQHRLGMEIPRLRARSVRVAYILDAISAVLGLLLMGLVFTDYRRRMRAQARFSERLEQISGASVRVSEAIANARELSPLFQKIVDEARAAMDADYAAIGIGTDPDQPFAPWAFSGMTNEQASALGHPPRPIGVLAQVILHEGPLRIDDLSKAVTFGGLPAGHPPLGSFLGIAVHRHGRSVANLFLARRPTRRPFTIEDEHIVEIFGADVAVAVENAALYTALQRERSTLQILADASAGMMDTLDRSERLDSIAHSVTPRFADICIIRTLEADGRFTPPTVASAQPEWAATVTEIARRFPTLTEAHHAMRARREQFPVAIELTQTFLEAVAQDPEHLALLQKLPMRWALSVPLLVRNQMIGVLTLLSSQQEAFDPTRIALAEEIARRAAMSIENARLYQKAEAAIRLRDDVLAIVSHDLRNPVAAIQMTAEMLPMLCKNPDPAKINQHAERLTRLSASMTRLISDLLLAAKIDSGTLTAETKPEPVQTLFDDVLTLFSARAEEKSVHLEVATPSGLPDVLCDHDRALQVLSNLIGNAIKFTPAGGAIRVAAEKIDDRVKFSVADTGPGIPAESLAHLFERYWQARETRRAGAGLGLYIAHGIVKTHGGEIWAANRPEGGAEFCFTLAAYGADRPERAATVH